MHTNNLKRLIFTALGVSLISTCISFAQEDIISFYPKAYAKTQNPPEEKKLMVIAEQKVEDKFVTFIGVEKGKVLLVAITKDKIKNPQKDISLKVRFKSKEIDIERFSMRLDNIPDAGKIQDGCYVFDRNADGKIDYVSSLLGIIPVKPKDFPSDFPQGRTNYIFNNDTRQIEFFKKNCQMVFNHLADDNFDGRVDGVVVERMDSERDWVDNWTIIRSSNFNDVLDTCWLFKDNINTKESNCLRAQKGYVARRAIRDLPEPENKDSGKILEAVPFYTTKLAEFGNEELRKESEVLSLLNQAANLCGLTKDSFYKE